MRQKAFVKNNPLTRAIEEGNRANAGTPIGSRIRRDTTVISAEVPPAVQTPAMRIPEFISKEDEERLREAWIKEAEKPQEQVPNISFMKSKRGIPDFTKVEGIDLINKVVVVDGAEFPIEAKDVAELKLFCIDLITKAITRQVALALVQYAVEARENEGSEIVSQDVQSTPAPQGERENEESGSSPSAESDNAA